MTSGCAAKTEKTTAPSADERSVSLTPKLWFVLPNMSSEKARAGKMLLAHVSASLKHPECGLRSALEDPYTAWDTCHTRPTRTQTGPPCPCELRDYIADTEYILCKVHIHSRRHDPVIPRIRPIAPVKRRPPVNIVDYAAEQPCPQPRPFPPRRPRRRARGLAGNVMVGIVVRLVLRQGEARCPSLFGAAAGHASRASHVETVGVGVCLRGGHRAGVRLFASQRA